MSTKTTYLDTLEKSIFLLSLLLAALKYEDTSLKNAIVKFMVYKLSDKEINKTYRSISKFLNRTGKSEEEFIKFLQKN